MDNKVYIITNCGSIKSIHDSEEAMRTEMQRLLECESKYRVTHYYYGKEEMTRAEFICKRICGKYEEVIRHNAEFMAKNTGQTADECYEQIYRTEYCSKCVLRDRSPHGEENNYDKKRNV